MATKKRRECLEPECSSAVWTNKGRCYWHWLLKQPIELQEDEAARRLAYTLPDRRRARIPEEQWPAGMRWCSGCQWFVPLYYCRGSRCRACASRATHRGAVERAYTWPDGVGYDDLLEAQGGRCGICRCTPQTRRLAVDHDHKTGLVRGLLCSGERGCNHGLLGAAHDDVEILRRAVYYLENPPAPWLAARRQAAITNIGRDAEVV